MPPRSLRSLLAAALVLASAALAPLTARAQLLGRGLGGMVDPTLRWPGDALDQLHGPRAPAPEAVRDAVLAPADLLGSRLARVLERARAYPRELDRDPKGALIVRGRLLAVPSGTAAREALLAAGFSLQRTEAMDDLGLRWLVLGPPAGLPLAEAIQRARVLDPTGVYDDDPIYLPSGMPEASSAPARPVAAPPSVPARAPPADAAAVRVGLVDSGVDIAHPVLREAHVQRHGCDGVAHPAAHGTAVASLLVGQGEGFRSAAPGATLFAADAFCDAPTGGSVEHVARALAWLVRERVSVANVSLVGPPNPILHRVVDAALARGLLVVAAVGNDGPAAPPLYPASWPGVVGVGAVDGRLRLLVEEARGPQVMFVAPGADMAAAAAGARGFVPVRGTSFASPLVAGLLAGLHTLPGPADARSAIEHLAAQARPPAGSPPADGYGRGLVGATLATAPDAVPLARLP